MELPPSLFEKLPLEVERLILDFALSLIRDDRARQAYRTSQLTVCKSWYSYSRICSEYFLVGEVEATGLYELLQKYEEFRLVVTKLCFIEIGAEGIGNITRFCQGLDHLTVFVDKDVNMNDLGNSLLASSLEQIKVFDIHTLMEISDLDPLYRAIESWPLVTSLKLQLHFRYPYEIPSTIASQRTTTVLLPPRNLTHLRLELDCIELVPTLASLITNSKTIKTLEVSFGDGDWAQDTINSRIKEIFSTIGSQCTELKYYDFDERLEEISPTFMAIKSLKKLEISLGSALENISFLPEMKNLEELVLHDVMKLEILSSHFRKHGAGLLKRIVLNLSDEYELDGEAAREFALITGDLGISVITKDAWDP